MAIRRVKLVFRDIDNIKDEIFVVTKLNNQEIVQVVNHHIEQYKNEEISYFQARRNIHSELTNMVHRNSYKQFTFEVYNT